MLLRFRAEGGQLHKHININSSVSFFCVSYRRNGTRGFVLFWNELCHFALSEGIGIETVQKKYIRSGFPYTTDGQVPGNTQGDNPPPRTITVGSFLSCFPRRGECKNGAKQEQRLRYCSASYPFFTTEFLCTTRTGDFVPRGQKILKTLILAQRSLPSHC